jgi:hypothetical protein
MTPKRLFVLVSIMLIAIVSFVSCLRETCDNCKDNRTCELVSDGSYACFDPVIIRGDVFDSATELPVEGAHIIAVDETGAAATDVAISDAEGSYELQVPVVRDPDGTLVEGTFTLRVAAADYLSYPHGLRTALPIDATQATDEEKGIWLVQNALTDIALIALSLEKQGQGSISGSVVADPGDTGPEGVLVVIEGESEEPLFGFSDMSGNYTIFNVPAGDWELHGYKAFLQLDPAPVSLSDGEDITGIDLTANTKPFGSVTGSINIVNAPGGLKTSVVLVPESTFSEAFVKGEVPPGLRAPAPPEGPSIDGSFSIEGVPDGDYVVLAAFENDLLVRDPDPSIAGTQILHIQVPDGMSYDINIASSFKVTEALAIVSPGADEAELVEGNLVFVWKDDSSEDKYSIVVYNAFGDEVWMDNNLPRVTGSENVTVDYDGISLEPGMYYQFRAMSWRDDGPISQTEDLLGVFFTPVE